MPKPATRNQRATPRPYLDPFDDFELLVAATRYFTGRRTIATHCFARKLAAVWPQLPPLIQKNIRRDLQNEFDSDDRSRNFSARHGPDVFHPLGQDCDRQSWELIRTAWQSPSPAPPP